MTDGNSIILESVIPCVAKQNFETETQGIENRTEIEYKHGDALRDYENLKQETKQLL